MKSFGLTDIGLSRKFNQDYSLECDEPIGNLDNLYVLCDGLGGHNAGEFASENAAEIFFDICESSDSKMPLSIFRESVNKVNELIYYKGREPEYQGMATTLVAATVRDLTAYIINVGDSRAYIIGDEITQITWDHSFPFRDKIQGIISAAASEVKYGLIRIHDNVIKSLKPVIRLYDTPVVGLTPVTVLPVFL